MNWFQKLKEAIGSKPKMTTTATLLKEPGGIYALRILGVLSKSTNDQIQAVAKRDIDAGATDLKVLIVLENFRGWKKGDDWSDIGFFAQYEANFSRLAVVGEPRWEAETLLFLGAKRRTGEVRYFETTQEAAARAWLTSGA